LHQLKDQYFALFPGLDEREKKHVQAADTVQQMASLFHSSLDRGMGVHLKVKTIFKQGDDDDDARMVYANEEEGADYFFTSTCMRTKRLSDAGDDLAYLYFYKNQP
jgi:hypothetical protein